MLRAQVHTSSSDALASTEVQRERVAAQLTMAMAAAHAGSWQFSPRTGEFSASDRAIELYGLPPGTHLNHERALACVHPADRAGVEAALRLTFESGEPFRHEHRVLQSDGSIRWVLSQALRQGEGDQICVVGLMQDVTERKEAQEQLRSSENRFRLAAEAVNGIIYEHDITTGHVEWQRGLYEVLGYHAAEVAPTAAWWREQIDPDDLERIELQFTASAGNSIVGEYRVRHRDGRWLHVEDRAVLQRGDDGRPVKMVGCTVDVTAQKQADAERRHRETFISGVLGSITDGFGVVCKDWRFTFANDELVRRIGKQRHEILGNAMWDLFPDAVGNHAYVQLHRAMAERVAVEYELYYEPWQRWMFEKVFPTADGGLAVYTRDITEHKLAEAALRISEERFRTLFESMDEGFCVVEMAFDEGGRAIDYRVMEMNPAFEKHTGMSGLVGKSIRQAIPDLEEFWYETYGRVAATGDATRFVHAAAPMDGRCFDVYAFRLGEAGSNKVAILFNDITATRQAEETLRASEARNSFLVTLADALRPLSDPIQVQAEASRVLGEQLGANRVVYFEVRGHDAVVERDYTSAAASIVGCHPLASFGEAQLAAHRAGRTTAEADVDALTSLTVEEKLAFAAVETRAYIAVPLVKDGAFIAGLVVNSTHPRTWTPTEIAMTEETAERTWAAVERARAEAGLRKSEQRRRLALDATELGTWHVEPATRATKTDARYRTIFGTTKEWTDYLQAVAVIHPDDQPAVLEAVATATRLENPTPFAIEYRIIHPDGSLRWVFANGRSSFEGMGPTRRVVSFDGTVADITDRKLIEQQRERLVAQLRDADRRKDEFLATLAHELRNPLAPLRSGLQMIRLAGANGTLEQARSMMDRQLTQLVRLVDDLMDVSRVTSGKMELRKRRIELRAVIDAAVETSQPSIAQAGHELTVVIPDAPMLLDADATRLAQVVSNLLNNSAKYTHRGGRIGLTAWRDGDTAVVSVKDNGIGIPPAMLERVFEIFTQVDRALEKSTGGLGIGLSLVKGLVEMHGGSIEARSDGQGAGSEFVLRLPVAMAVVAGPSRAGGQASQVVPSALRRILIVDDNVDAAESLGQLLEMSGHEVRTANDGEAGMAVAAQFRPNVVLLDIGMPKLNGYETASRIRQQPWGQAMVLVALTGWGQADDRRKSADAGFDHHLVKPVEMDDVERLLEASRL